jgi:hypothetical protein
VHKAQTSRGTVSSQHIVPSLLSAPASVSPSCSSPPSFSRPSLLRRPRSRLQLLTLVRPAITTVSLSTWRDERHKLTDWQSSSRLVGRVSRRESRSPSPSASARRCLPSREALRRTRSILLRMTRTLRPARRTCVAPFHHPAKILTYHVQILNRIRNGLASCPQQKFVLMGYSQGASCALPRPVLVLISCTQGPRPPSTRSRRSPPRAGTAPPSLLSSSSGTLSTCRASSRTGTRAAGPPPTVRLASPPIYRARAFPLRGTRPTGCSTSATWAMACAAVAALPPSISCTAPRRACSRSAPACSHRSCGKE